MKKFVLTLAVIFPAILLYSQNLNINYRSKMSFPGQSIANVWGYSAEGREYALLGGSKGLIVVDITNPDTPQQIVQIPGPNNLWKEIKTYRNYAYIVSEGGQGVQIINLNNLPSPNLPYHYYTGDGPIQGQLGKVHALHIDIAAGFLYAYGGNLFSGGAKILNLNADPYNPTYAGKFDQLGYIHDGYVDNDTLYGGHIYQGRFSVVDMHDKNDPQVLTTQNTPNNFTHNTWLSDDRRTLFTTDETANSFLAAFDVSDLNDIRLLDKIQSNPGSNSAVHNTHILGNFAVTAWYKDGFTVVDVSRPDNLVEVGHYDTYPGGSGSGYEGCWGVYPYFPSGNVIASTITAAGTSTGEMWVLTPEYLRACYLEGKITNGLNDNPMNGALIEVVGSQQENTTANGLYKMGQEKEGYYTVRISKSGFQSQEFTVYFQRGVVRNLNTALYPTGGLVIDGQVTSAYDGAPVANATVSFSSWSGQWETTTDMDGLFVLNGLPAGLFDIITTAPGFGLSTKYKKVIVGDETIPIVIAPKIKGLIGNGSSEKSALTVWPNPFRESFQVAVPGYDVDYRLKIFDQTGQLLTELNRPSSDAPMDLGKDWPPGVFFLQLVPEDGGPVMIQKVVKAF